MSDRARWRHPALGAPHGLELPQGRLRYFDHREIDQVAPRGTPGLASFQNWMQFDSAARRSARLRELARDDVEIFCTHDPVELRRYR